MKGSVSQTTHCPSLSRGSDTVHLGLVQSLNLSEQLSQRQRLLIDLLKESDQVDTFRGL